MVPRQGVCVSDEGWTAASQVLLQCSSNRPHCAVQDYLARSEGKRWIAHLAWQSGSCSSRTSAEGFPQGPAKSPRQGLSRPRGCARCCNHTAALPTWSSRLRFQASW